MSVQWIRLECRCGHHAEVKIASERWMHRDEILPRARCSKCGKRGADHLQVAHAPGTPGMGRAIKTSEV